jgi:predicted outer membrane repeat protein
LNPEPVNGYLFYNEKGDVHVAFLQDYVIRANMMHLVQTLIKFTLRRLPFLAGIGLLVLSQNCAGPPISVRRAPVPETMVSVSVPEIMVAEGESARFCISRDAGEGDLAVNLSVSGDADFEKDYTLRGADDVEATQVRVTIPDGRVFVELTLEAVDDVPAEGDETITLAIQPGTGYAVDATASSATVRIPRNDFAVTTTDDAGEGSLRQAILNANKIKGPNTITFDTAIGPFAMPQTIAPAGELPDLAEEVTIDGYIHGRLWRPTGVTVSGGNQGRVFNVVPGARVTISSLTIADGRARDGGGIANRGKLVVKGVTFAGNVAEHQGGGLANLGGTVTVINSTFADNSSGEAGGGLADDSGKVTVTNCTFSGNRAKKGGGLFSSGTLLLCNTILANSKGGADCVASGTLDPAGTNNLIEAHIGCGEPISTANPRLANLGGYNGPTPTFPLGGGSPAVNLGDNASAVNEQGEPLKWDQRGNGDPRFVAGITDIGAFEQQAFPRLTVDTFEDTELRGCTRSGPADCSLRGAITLANATKKFDVITFDPKVFAVPRTIILAYPLPDLATDMTIDGSGTAGVTVITNGRFDVLNIDPGAKVRLIDIWTDEK